MLASPNRVWYGSYMNQRRGPQEGSQTSQAAGHREADAPIRPSGDVSVRELLVAGGLRGFTPHDMFPEVAA